MLVIKDAYKLTKDMITRHFDHIDETREKHYDPTESVQCMHCLDHVFQRARGRDAVSSGRAQSAASSAAAGALLDPASVELAHLQAAAEAWAASSGDDLPLVSPRPRAVSKAAGETAQPPLLADAVCVTPVVLAPEPRYELVDDLLVRKGRKRRASKRALSQETADVVYEPVEAAEEPDRVLPPAKKWRLGVVNLRGEGQYAELMSSESVKKFVDDSMEKGDSSSLRGAAAVLLLWAREPSAA